MGRRVADPRVDSRPLIVRIGLMVLGTVVLVVGSAMTLLLIGTFFANWDSNLTEVGHTDNSAGGAILGIAAVCAMVAFGGWTILLIGRYGPRKKYPRGGKHRRGGDGDD